MGLVVSLGFRADFVGGSCEIQHPLVPSCPDHPTQTELKLRPSSRSGAQGGSLLYPGLELESHVPGSEMALESAVPGPGFILDSPVPGLILDSHIPGLRLVLDSPGPGLILDSADSGPGLAFWAWIALRVIEVSLNLEMYRIQGKTP